MQSHSQSNPPATVMEGSGELTERGLSPVNFLNTPDRPCPLPVPPALAEDSETKMGHILEVHSVLSRGETQAGPDAPGQLVLEAEEQVGFSCSCTRST